MPTDAPTPVTDSVLAHVSTAEKLALRHFAASKGVTLSRAVRSLIQDAIATAMPKAVNARKGR